jgi:Mrp family chromosome partitioning ATPase
VEEARRTEEGLKKELALLDERLASFTSRYAEGLTLESQIASAREQLKVIDGRIDALVYETDAPGFAWLASPARTPEIPLEGGRKKVFGMLLVLFGAASLALPIALDLLDARVHSPNDAERALGFPPLGWIVARDAVHLEPFAADQRRRAALALERERTRSGARLFVLMGVRAGGGTSTLVLDLAHELATLGVRALAVEANALRPESRFSGDSPSPGLAAVLAGALEAQDAVLHGEGPDPDRIPVGEPRAVRHLDGLMRLPEALAPLFEKYDVALVDAPPLGVSADAELLVSLADVVILVVEAEVVQQSELVRARRLLDRLGPRCVGALVNRVRVYEGGGYFAERVAELTTGMKSLAPGWQERIASWTRWGRG